MRIQIVGGGISEKHLESKVAAQNFCQTVEKLILCQIIPNIFIVTLTKTALKVGGGLGNSSHER